MKSCIFSLFLLSALIFCSCQNQRNTNEDKLSEVSEKNDEPLNTIKKDGFTTNLRLILPASISSGTVSILNSTGEETLFSYELESNSFIESIKLDSASLYQLKVGNRVAIPLLFTKRDSLIDVIVKNNSFDLDYEINGSVENRIFQEYLTNYAPDKKHDTKDKLSFLSDNSPSFAVANIYTFEFMAGVYPYVEKFDEMKEIFKDFSYANGLLNDINKLTSGILGYGKVFPEFDLPTISLSYETLGPNEFKGKYLLIDFWASWCGPCRAENPKVKRVYEQYSRKDFEILGVSIDRSEEKWLGAIKQDKLNWNHVLDKENALVQKLGINAVPAIFLLNRKGEIIGKNLRGVVLENALNYFLTK